METLFSEIWNRENNMQPKQAWIYVHAVAPPKYFLGRNHAVIVPRL